MKLENQVITRQFHYDGQRFYTESLTNNLLKQTVPTLAKDEFSLSWVAGGELLSSQMQASIVEQTEQALTVRFVAEQAQVSVCYQVRPTVISKQLTVEWTTERLNAIVCELLEFENTADVYPLPPQADNQPMANFKGYYMSLGQPIYAKSYFMGAEFPLVENFIEETRCVSRYYYGQQVEQSLILHPTIIGAATSLAKQDIQSAFFAYLDTVKLPAKFRKQYNSWYDHMLDINEANIIESFREISKGFNDYGIQLDALVVDDGWANYQSVWEFNQKFPNELAKVSTVVKELNSTLGLWIGPRGGYGGTQVIMSDWLEQHPELGLGSKNKKSNDVNVGDFRYLTKMKEKMLAYQRKYDISYWKIDGMLLEPDTEDESGDYAMYTMTSVYEFTVQMLQELRAARQGQDYWLNLTSYVNPSPWWLLWVNSLWIQVSEDIGFTENGGNDTERMLTYRDGQYYEFLTERDIRLPLSSLYNHEPIYAATASRWYLDHQMHSSVAEFRDYLYFIATRGNGFWEFYYSYHMFEPERWQANAEVMRWIEAHYTTLQYSVQFGAKASEMTGIYGYLCENPKTQTAIVAFRNPTALEQTYTIPLNYAQYDIVCGQGKLKQTAQGWQVTLAPRALWVLQVS